MVYNPKQMTFSAFERYVTIVETIRNSDCHLTMANRMELISDLLESGQNLNTEQIKQSCLEKEQQCLEYNMVSSRVMREYSRGY